jgi:hypothetical protein
VHGIYAANSDENTICTNYVYGQNDHTIGQNSYGKGIALLNSPNNQVSCNTARDLRKGIEFRLNCNTPDGVSGNKLLSADNGISAGENVGANVMLGVQNSRGNLWVADPNFYFFGADYQGNPFNITMGLEKFFVTAAANSTYTDPITGIPYFNMAVQPPSSNPNDWFAQPVTPQNTYVCGSRGNNGSIPCWGNHIPPGFTGDGAYRNYGRGEYSFQNVSPAFEWTVRKQLYAELRENYLPSNIPSDFVAFYAAQTGTSVFKSWEIDNALSAIGNNAALTLPPISYAFKYWTVLHIWL